MPLLPPVTRATLPHTLNRLEILTDDMMNEEGILENFEYSRTKEAFSI
jgi:hypothetical protein